MDRREAILRELNLYPQWMPRGQPAPKAPQGLALHSQSTKPQAASRWLSHPEGVGNPLSAEADVELALPVSVEQPVQVVEEQHAHVSPASRLGGGEADTQRSVLGMVALNPSYVSSPSDRGEMIANFDWPQLKDVVHNCTVCKLRAGCTQTVFGVGDEKADWLFVGEGPGADEDAQGEPFVGQAGKLLDNMLAAIKLKRGKNVYIANIVKCRPPDNRTPAADEIAQCLPYLHRQIALIQPKLIVALGKVASNALLGKDATIASLREKLHDYHGIPLIVTYHPAYLLRSPSEKAKAWQDLLLAVRSMEGGVIPFSN